MALNGFDTGFIQDFPHLDGFIKIVSHGFLLQEIPDRIGAGPRRGVAAQFRVAFPQHSVAAVVLSILRIDRYVRRAGVGIGAVSKRERGIGMQCG